MTRKALLLWASKSAGLPHSSSVNTACGGNVLVRAVTNLWAAEWESPGTILLAIPSAKAPGRGGRRGGWVWQGSSGDGIPVLSPGTQWAHPTRLPVQSWGTIQIKGHWQHPGPLREGLQQVRSQQRNVRMVGGFWSHAGVWGVGVMGRCGEFDLTFNAEDRGARL